ncbi:MAG TPA: dihydrofolate reductase family protein [Frankiaceae bacterium]|jgi:dihydrofolate reductase|nr:dihydrofolate reductase family protein [Frankiaceae bacterium]
MLIYSAIASVDGYIEDESGEFGWAMPSEEVHAFVNDLVRGVGTYLYGRRLYETMAFWESPEAEDEPVMADFARVWRAADKVVYSTTLAEPATPRTRIERSFDPDAVRATEGDAVVGGPTLAAHAFRAGLVGECHLLLVPYVTGGGKPALPRDQRLRLALRDERRFADGTVYLRYDVAGDGA